MIETCLLISSTSNVGQSSGKVTFMDLKFIYNFYNNFTTEDTLFFFTIKRRGKQLGFHQDNYK
jgi:hypothetical protein